MKINPDIPEGHKLRGWFDNGGAEQEVTSLSTRNQNAVNYNSDWLTFDEVKEKNLGAGDTADYFLVKGVIHMVRNTNAMYKACPQADCNKKISDLENGMYRCEKCNADFPNFKYRMLLNVSYIFFLTQSYFILIKFFFISFALLIQLVTTGLHHSMI